MGRLLDSPESNRADPLLAFVQIDHQHFTTLVWTRGLCQKKHLVEDIGKEIRRIIGSSKNNEVNN